MTKDITNNVTSICMPCLKACKIKIYNILNMNHLKNNKITIMSGLGVFQEKFLFIILKFE